MWASSPPPPLPPAAFASSGVVSGGDTTLTTSAPLTSPGAIAGIALACAALLGCVLLACTRRRSARRAQSQRWVAKAAIGGRPLTALTASAASGRPALLLGRGLSGRAAPPPHLFTSGTSYAVCGGSANVTISALLAVYKGRAAMLAAAARLDAAGHAPTSGSSGEWPGAPPLQRSPGLETLQRKGRAPVRDPACSAATRCSQRARHTSWAGPSARAAAAAAWRRLRACPARQTTGRAASAGAASGARHLRGRSACCGTRRRRRRTRGSTPARATTRSAQPQPPRASPQPRRLLHGVTIVHSRSLHEPRSRDGRSACSCVMFAHTLRALRVSRCCRTGRRSCRTAGRRGLARARVAPSPPLLPHQPCGTGWAWCTQTSLSVIHG